MHMSMIQGLNMNFLKTCTDISKFQTTKGRALILVKANNYDHDHGT